MFPLVDKRFVNKHESAQVRRGKWGGGNAHKNQHLVIKDPIIHSIRKSNYYCEDEKLAVIVVCSKYEKVRTKEGCAGY